MPAARDRCGAMLPTQPPERDALQGMGEIAAYSGFSEKIIKRLAQESAFPLAHIAERWVSSRSMVDMWLRQEIEKSVKRYL